MASSYRNDDPHGSGSDDDPEWVPEGSIDLNDDGPGGKGDDEPEWVPEGSIDLNDDGPGGKGDDDPEWVPERSIDLNDDGGTSTVAAAGGGELLVSQLPLELQLMILERLVPDPQGTGDEIFDVLSARMIMYNWLANRLAKPAYKRLHIMYGRFAMDREK